MWKYYALRLTYLLLGRLPLRVLYGIAHLVGDGAFLLRSSTRRAVIANMRQVMGPEASEREVRLAARDVFRNATRYYADLIHIPRLDVQRFFKEKVDVQGLEYLAEARDSGRGAVVVGIHFGNPEMAVQGIAGAGFAVFALAEPLEPQQLSDLTNRLRSQHGHEYRSVGFGAVKEAMRRIKQGGLIAILLDRDVGGTGVPMQFCGAEAAIPLGGVDLALRSGAYLIPAWAWRIGGYRFRIRIGPPLELVRTGSLDEDVQVNAERLLTSFEGRLRSDPGQWAVLEPIWRTQEDGPPASSSAVQ
jgi:KDO2-lipid IV(A) lauroyltransferase